MKLVSLSKLRALSYFVFVAMAVTISNQVATGGGLVGVVVSTDDRPVSGALVTVTDSSTGIVITGPRSPSGFSVMSAVTDSHGHFQMDVPAGTYNVLAQQWDSPSLKWEHGFFPGLDLFGESVSAAGTAAEVPVPSPRAENLQIKAAGSGSVDVHFESGNNDGSVVISAAPPLDPIFGLKGWIGDFATSAVALNRAPLGRTQFHNLPSGRLYVAVFGNDNNSCFSLAEVQVRDRETTTVNLEWVGPWSNARHTPPVRLKELYDKVVAKAWGQKDFPDIPIAALSLYKWDMEKFRKFLEQKDRVVTLPDGSTASLLDVATAMAYRILALELKKAP